MSSVGLPSGWHFTHVITVVETGEAGETTTTHFVRRTGACRYEDRHGREFVALGVEVHDSGGGVWRGAVESAASWVKRHKYASGRKPWATP